MIKYNNCEQRRVQYEKTKIVILLIVDYADFSLWVASNKESWPSDNRKTEY